VSAEDVFEVVEQESKVSREEHDAAVPELRVALLNAQCDLGNSDHSVIVVLGGLDFQGRDELLNTLHEWMDARFMDVESFVPPTAEDEAHPIAWRVWRRMPLRGRVALFLSDWTTTMLADLQEDGEVDAEAFTRRVEAIRRLEKLMTADGTQLIKIWLHLSKSELKKRRKKGRKKQAGASFGDEDQAVLDEYEKGLPWFGRIIEATGTADSPWHLIDSAQKRHRELAVGRVLLRELEARLASADSPPVTDSGPVLMAVGADGQETSGRQPKTLADVDLTPRLDEEEYDERRKAAQARLSQLGLEAREQGLSTVLAFEGWDAAGKGGTIRRITSAWDARYYRVIPIAAPTDEERAHHYLWRFWRHVPRDGHSTIYDRTWYGRVLVERVEGFAEEAAWRRAYDEIVQFERQLSDHGMVVQKFWLHIDPDEQLARFKAREKTLYKKYKITAEDYRNRERWDEYAAAVDEMVARTDRPSAPWHLVASNDKRSARVQVLETVCQALEERLAARQASKKRKRSR